MGGGLLKRTFERKVETNTGFPTLMDTVEMTTIWKTEIFCMHFKVVHRVTGWRSDKRKLLKSTHPIDQINIHKTNFARYTRFLKYLKKVIKLITKIDTKYFPHWFPNHSLSKKKSFARRYLFWIVWLQPLLFAGDLNTRQNITKLICYTPLQMASFVFCFWKNIFRLKSALNIRSSYVPGYLKFTCLQVNRFFSNSIGNIHIGIYK